MDLHSGGPYWLLRNALEERHAPVPSAIDVAIVGAGITGAMVADRLSERGVGVALFDRGAPGEGSTAASTALLQAEIDQEFLTLAREIGERDAARAYRACRAALAELELLIRGLGDTGFARRDSLYLASSASDGKRLEEEAGARVAHGLPVELLSARDVAGEYGLPSHGALRTRPAGVVDPVRLTRRLIDRAVSRGAGIVARTPVRRVDPSADLVVIETEEGIYTAKHVVFATGYELPELVRSELVTLRSTYALVTEPVGDPLITLSHPLIWETARPYSYLRSTDDGRILIGGMDLPFVDPARRDRHLPERTRQLERQLSRWLPAVELETAYAWSGTFAESKDGLPFIGAIPGAPRAFAALGYGGNGILFSVLAAGLLADELLTGAGPLADLFRFDR